MFYGTWGFMFKKQRLFRSVTCWKLWMLYWFSCDSLCCSVYGHQCSNDRLWRRCCVCGPKNLIVAERVQSIVSSSFLSSLKHVLRANNKAFSPAAFLSTNRFSAIALFIYNLQNDCRFFFCWLKAKFTIKRLCLQTQCVIVVHWSLWQTGMQLLGPTTQYFWSNLLSRHLVSYDWHQLPLYSYSQM